MLCGCRYFTASSILDNKITLTDLDFGLFTSVLLEDIGFNPTKYGIFYCNSRGRRWKFLPNEPRGLLWMKCILKDLIGFIL